MSENVIELSNVSKQFVSTKHEPGWRGAVKGLFTKEKVTKTAVDDVSLAIQKGEIVGYIGSNGAGKKNAKNIGVVFGQRTQLWWDLPLSETYTVLKEIYDVSDDDYQERMNFFEEVLGLQEFIHSTVRTLSLGQRMRADLAAGLF